MEKYVDRAISFTRHLRELLSADFNARNVALYMSVMAAIAVLGRNKLRTFWRIFHRDAVIIYKFVETKYALRCITNDTTVVEMFRKRVARHPQKPLFIGRERQWTYLEAEEYTNRVANYFAKMGFREGDVIALIMENRPEYVLLWLGLSKIGVVTALINTNLRSKPLVHSINVADSKAIILSAAMAPNLIASKDELADSCGNLRYFVFGDCAETAVFHAERIDNSIWQASAEPPAYRAKLHDKLIYIYTSGTTGLPKAAVIKHSRYLYIGISISKVIPVTDNDVLYVYLPMYHAAASVLGMAHPLMSGTTGVIVTKFSASRFWADCAEYNVTIAQYIGEVCRYLLMQPPRASDRQHRVKCLYGNGLRKDIWNEFRDRFGLDRVVELYGSTEGTTSLANLDNTPGSIGYVPWASKFVGKYMPINLIKVDPTTGEPIRDANGRCIICKPGETGEIVAKIRDNDLMARFDGYVNKAATSKKIYTDCFSKGDRVFASGDLLYKDDLGYFYFMDRRGDTFRWKGENCSTAEVEIVLNTVIKDPSIGCTVVGVEVPGNEGRAGMAILIDPHRSIDLTKLADGLRASLPSYAVPLFLRVTSQDDVTGTFKMTKVNYQKAGFDLEQCHPDPVYFLDSSSKPPRYVPLDRDLLDRINNCQVRV